MTTIEIGIGREHLFSATGFLDDNWFHRSYWVYGNSFLEGCSVPSGGWFEMGRISPSGKMLCFDDTNVYGYGQFPEYSKWSTPLRYSLFSMDKKPKSYQPGTPDAELRKTRPNWRKYRTLRCPKVEFDFHWKSGVPVRAKAIVKTPDTLFVAGPEDILDEEKVFQDARSEANQKLLQKQNELINVATEREAPGRFGKGWQHAADDRPGIATRLGRDGGGLRQTVHLLPGRVGGRLRHLERPFDWAQEEAPAPAW